ncbi:MAG: YiiX/YebB-like N1pC/P60 family cysteine hydrolase [Gammaproteobacteria bacterium]|nr:YiiX/YebB-like N1pC/P60 family cysteine hydrolase [Gammaproteobacteria bacterium]
MSFNIKTWLWNRAISWLNDEKPSTQPPLSDYQRLSYEIRPGDVLLVEGRSRVSEVIKCITLSSWTHSALYIGRLHDIDAPEMRGLIEKHYPAKPDEQLIIEALLGEGTVIRPLNSYENEHLRICRPKGLSRQDSQYVVNHLIANLGLDYDIRQLLDLARFLFPYNILPRRYRSSLFSHHVGTPTRTVCSALIAQAFASVRFPVLPVLRNEQGNIKFYRRNFRLFTPRDFDYSPYFDIIKYPIFEFDDLALYRKLPWNEEGVIYNDSENPLEEVLLEPAQSRTLSHHYRQKTPQENSHRFAILAKLKALKISL